MHKIDSSLFRIGVDKVHPKQDTKWVYIAEIDHMFDMWRWKNGKWSSSFVEGKFPDYSSMIGYSKDN